MRDQRLDKLADVLVNYSTGVKKGDVVSIRGDPVAMPAIEAVYEKVLQAGGHPLWIATPHSLSDILLETGTDEQLQHLPSMYMHEIETVDVRISFWAETNTRAGGSADPSRASLMSRARKPYMAEFMRRESAGEIRWVGTLYPTLASAQDAEMSLRAYEDFVFRAGLLHLDDPAAAWKAIGERQKKLADWLDTKKELRFTAPPRDGDDGTDLTVSVDGSTWINCCGDANFPDGEVFAGPKDVNGHVNYTFPAVHNGREVEGVRLAFRDGRVVDASARKNEAFLIEMLDQDEGARNLGEIAIGTNYAITDYTRNTLFDEKIGGTFHAAVGAGYPESGNTNESGLHWDMVCDMRPPKYSGEIAADGKVFFRDGRFLNPDFPQPE